MKILILNTHNPFNATGIVALDLFNQLKLNGHEVNLLVNSYDKNYPEGIISLESHSSYFWKTIWVKIMWRVNRFKDFLKLKEKKVTNSDYCFYQLDEQKQIYKTNKLLRLTDNKVDAIIILYSINFINIKNIYELYSKTSAKIYWLMYDMAPFTGGCHYAWDCTGYQNSCGTCPGLFSSDPFDRSHKNLAYKKEFVDKTDITLLAGSELQYQQAKKSTLFKNKQVLKMLLTVDSTIFKPVDKAKLRTDMKIPPNKKVIFFGAVGLGEARKGMSYLIESLKKLKERIKDTDSELDNNIFLIIAGKYFDSIANLLPYDFKYLGYLNNTDGIASAYQAADVFICPSIEDSGPTMINQSIMAGTPVVSFETGVSLDLVITGETGYRAKLRDSNDMAEGIYNLLKLDSTDYEKISSKCRDLALQLCSNEVRMEMFESLFKKSK